MPTAAVSIADIVSLSRLALASLFIAIRSPASRIAVIAAAAATDWLDGWLARRHGASRYGAIVDPAADRVFVVVVLLVLLADGALNVAQSLVFLARDIVTTVGAAAVRVVPRLGGTRLRARFSGKVVTALQFVVLAAAIVRPSSVTWLIVVLGIVTVASIADYGAATWRSRASA